MIEADNASEIWVKLGYGIRCWGAPGRLRWGAKTTSVDELKRLLESGVALGEATDDSGSFFFWGAGDEDSPQ